VLRTISAITNQPAEIVHRINDGGVAASVIATGDVIGVLPATPRRAPTPSCGARCSTSARTG
jgi:hypothetical protein